MIYEILLVVFVLSLYPIYLIVDYVFIKPKQFLAFYEAQGLVVKKFVPFIGELDDIRKSVEADRLVEDALLDTQKYGKVRPAIIGPMPVLVLNDPEYLRPVFTSAAGFYHKATDSQKDIFRPLLKNGLLLSEDDYWNRNRKLVSPAFHFVNLKEMVPMMVGAAEACANKWTDRILASLDKNNNSSGTVASADIEIGHEFNELTLDTVATAAFGTAFSKQPELANTFTKSSKIVLELIQQRSLNFIGMIPVIKSLPFAGLPEIQSNCLKLDKIVKELVSARIAGTAHSVGGRKDLLDLMLEARGEDGSSKLSFEQVCEESVTFISAGAETTSNLLTWCMYRLVTENDGALWDRCVEEVDTVCGDKPVTADQLKDLKFIEACLYEALRLHPPAPNLTKLSTVDHELNGLKILKGTTISVNLNVVHRLPDHWPDPESFKPERFMSSEASNENEENNNSNSTEPKQSQHPFAFLGFSAGPRKCLGKNFAMMEMKSILATIFQKFEMKLVLGQKILAHPITRVPKFGIVMTVSKRTKPLSINKNINNSAKSKILKPVGMI